MVQAGRVRDAVRAKQTLRVRARARNRATALFWCHQYTVDSVHIPIEKAD
ncbi:uncharacterized protein EKO05_0010914 [Ascochyta rabiei]|nr:uncharacterized protein EKO05_0010914 [Ascochyta rabiei]UPX20689.1 hypothetical protein EKO05_0010914 [Ascochyta rabiei]